MSTTMPEGYYNRHDPAKNFDAHLFRAGFAVQSSEFNEVQSNFAGRIQGVADALFRDGDVIRDARVIVNAGRVDAKLPRDEVETLLNGERGGGEYHRFLALEKRLTHRRPDIERGRT